MFCYILGSNDKAPVYEKCEIVVNDSHVLKRIVYK